MRIDRRIDAPPPNQHPNLLIVAHVRYRTIAETGENPNLSLGEHIVEAGYGIQVSPWMQVHPNLQFIGNPGAFSFKHVSNAWVFGSEVKVTF